MTGVRRFWAGRTPREKRIIPVAIAAIALVTIQAVTYNWPPKQVVFVFSLTNVATLGLALFMAWGREGWR